MILAWVIAAYLVMSVVAAGALALDKRAAIKGRRRTPEARLHLLELLGGWPGALLAIHFLRHKSSKPSYFLLTWGIALVHVVGIGAVLATR